MRALVLPGAAYTAAMPLLSFARTSLREHGYDVVSAAWDGVPVRALSSRDADAEVAASLHAGGCDVLELPHADHAMSVPDATVRSTEIHLDVVRATDLFLRSLVAPW